MACLDLELLERMVNEQQSQIKVLSSLGNYLVEAHFAFRQRYADLHEHQVALLSILVGAGLVRTDEVAKLVNKQRYARIFCKMLEDPSIGCGILMCSDVNTCQAFCNASTSCRGNLTRAMCAVVLQLDGTDSEFDEAPGLAGDQAGFQDGGQRSELGALAAKLKVAIKEEHHLTQAGAWPEARLEPTEFGQQHGPQRTGQEGTARQDARFTDMENMPLYRCSSRGSGGARDLSASSMPEPLSVETCSYRLDEDVEGPAWRTIMLRGLQTRADLNGMIGTAVCSGDSSGRWNVQLHSGEKVRVQKVNLRFIDTDRPEPALGFPQDVTLCRQVRRPCCQIPLALRASFGRIAFFGGADTMWTLEALSQWTRREFLCFRKLYACGGCDGNRALDSAELFNPLVGRWVPAPTLIAGRQGGVCSVLSRRLYVTGGNNHNHVLDTVESLDPLVNEWMVMPRMCQARIGHSAAVMRGYIYVVGGMGQYRNVLASCERFDPTTAMWELLPHMRHGRLCSEVLARGGQLYVCGGTDDHTSKSALERFNSEACTWDSLNPLSVPRCWAATAVLLDDLWFFCGGFAEETFASVEAFSFTTGRWHPARPMLHARMGAAMHSTTDQITVCGGSQVVCPCATASNVPKAARRSLILCSVERFDLSSGVWEELEPMATFRVFATATYYRGFLYVFGGKAPEDDEEEPEVQDLKRVGKDSWESRATGDVERFDYARGTWETMKSMNKGRYSFGFGRIHIDGGAKLRAGYGY